MKQLCFVKRTAKLFLRMSEILFYSWKDTRIHVTNKTVLSSWSNETSPPFFFFGREIRVRFLFPLPSLRINLYIEQQQQKLDCVSILRSRTWSYVLSSTRCLHSTIDRIDTFSQLLSLLLTDQVRPDAILPWTFPPPLRLFRLFYISDNPSPAAYIGVIGYTFANVQRQKSLLYYKQRDQQSIKRDATFESDWLLSIPGK